MNLINETYLNRKHELPERLTSLVDSLEGNQALSGEFILGNLMYCDFNITNEALLDTIEQASKVYRKDEYPLEIFLNYVVYPKVNNEILDGSRSMFYQEVKHLLDTDIFETIKNLNYWCAQEVRYQTTDARTKYPSLTYTSGSGRCGEKSTFLTQVYRSVGIPARQIYVPWWTHSDDRHAWVEVYYQNEWRYLGAGDGEEVLDKAWFSLAASRAALIHANHFSNIDTNEPLLDTTLGHFKTLNVTSHYTKTSKRTIYNEIEGLKFIELVVLNYGKFRSFARFDLTNGLVEIEFGQGDVFIKAYHDKKLIFKKFDTETITITQEDFITQKHAFMQSPGSANTNLQYDETDEMRLLKAEKRKLALSNYAKKMEGVHLNQEEIDKCYEALGANITKALFAALSPKDIEDIQSEILVNHYNHTKQFKDNYTDDIFYNYVANPRIYWEHLSDYTDKFASFSNNPIEIYTEIMKQVKIDTQYLVPDSYIPFELVWKLKKGSALDRDLLVVAVCRSQGIAARYNDLTLEIEYYNGNEFVSFMPGNKSFTLTLNGNTKDISVCVVPVNSTNPGANNRIETHEISLSQGQYEIITSKRLPNGRVIGSIELIDLNKDKTIQLQIDSVRDSDMLENEDIFDLINEIGLDQSGILVIGNAIEEPVAHALNELIAIRETLNNIEMPIYFVAKNECEASDLVLSAKSQLNQFEFFPEFSKDLEDRLIRRVFREPNAYPFVAVFKNGKTITTSSGYNVGSIDNTWLPTLIKGETK